MGGDFAYVNGVTHSGIVRLNNDGTLNTGFNFNPASMPGLSNIQVKGCSDDDGGAFLVNGKATYNGATHGFVARLLHDGSLDTTFAVNGQSPVPNVILFNGEVRGRSGEEESGILTIVGDFTQILDAPPIPRGAISPGSLLTADS